MFSICRASRRDQHYTIGLPHFDLLPRPTRSPARLRTAPPAQRSTHAGQRLHLNLRLSRHCTTSPPRAPCALPLRQPRLNSTARSRHRGVRAPEFNGRSSPAPSRQPAPAQHDTAGRVARRRRRDPKPREDLPPPRPPNSCWRSRRARRLDRVKATSPLSTSQVQKLRGSMTQRSRSLTSSLRHPGTAERPCAARRADLTTSACCARPPHREPTAGMVAC